LGRNPRLFPPPQCSFPSTAQPVRRLPNYFSPPLVPESKPFTVFGLLIPLFFLKPFRTGLLNPSLFWGSMIFKAVPSPLRPQTLSCFLRPSSSLGAPFFFFLPPQCSMTPPGQTPTLLELLFFFLPLSFLFSQMLVSPVPCVQFMSAPVPCLLFCVTFPSLPKLWLFTLHRCHSTVLVAYLLFFNHADT